MISLILVVLGCVLPNQPSWDALEAGLLANQNRVLDASAFDFQVSRTNETVHVQNLYTSGLVFVSYRIGTDNSCWFYRERSIGADDAMVQSRMRDNPQTTPEYDDSYWYTPDEQCQWNSEAMIGRMKPESAPHLLTGIHTDFLSLDFRSRIRRELRQNEVDYKIFGDQLEMPSLCIVAKEFRRKAPASLRAVVIDSIDCWEFGDATDKVAVAPTLNFALVRRESSVRLQTELKKFSLTNHNFRDVGGGFFVPSDFKSKLYAKPGEDKKLHNVHVVTVDYHVDFFRFAPPDSSILKLRFPVGFVVQDNIRGVAYRIEKATDAPYTDAITEGRRLLYKINDRRKKASGSRWLYFVGGGIVIVACIGVWLWQRRS
jgi:hypothetical protein